MQPHLDTYCHVLNGRNVIAQLRVMKSCRQGNKHQLMREPLLQAASASAQHQLAIDSRAAHTKLSKNRVVEKALLLPAVAAAHPG